MSRLLLETGVPHGFDPAGRLPAGAIRARQVHGARVVDATGREPPGPGSTGGWPGEADALLARHPGPAVAVVTADCAPLLLADPGGGGVAAVHAGWRGLAAGVIERAIDALGRPPAELIAAIGPAAGACCYEVGVEVLESLRLTARDAAVAPGPRGRPHLDVRTAARGRLLAAGLDARRIERVGPCTICSDCWPSYRRQGESAGRASSWIAPRER